MLFLPLLHHLFFFLSSFLQPCSLGWVVTNLTIWFHLILYNISSFELMIFSPLKFVLTISGWLHRSSNSELLCNIISYRPINCSQYFSFCNFKKVLTLFCYGQYFAGICHNGSNFCMIQFYLGIPFFDFIIFCSTNHPYPACIIMLCHHQR